MGDKKVDKVKNLKTAEGITGYMSDALSPDDWNDRCDEVKLANDGDYPSFWWATVVGSGLFARMSMNW